MSQTTTLATIGQDPREVVPPLLRWYPPEAAPLLEQPEAVQAKVTLWERINRYLAELKHPDHPPYEPTEEHWRLHLSPAMAMAMGWFVSGRPTKRKVHHLWAGRRNPSAQT